MNRLNRKHFLPGLLLGFLIAAGTACICSCSDAVNESAQNGYAVVTQKRSSSNSEYTRFSFTLPPNGSDKIYAERTTADDDASATAYLIRAIDAADAPYDALTIKLVPQHTNASGTVVKAYATVRVTEYTEEITSSNSGSYYMPKTWFYTITSDNGLCVDDYHAPLAAGGIFTFDFAADVNHAVEASSDYSELTYAMYPLLNLTVAAPVK